ncbi:MAG: molybdopterin-dependent oxidoreductase, partial [Actinobacteria bacterium]|nr:molybdopterin-dependent oxidoreductase [Actinomycetota bacterium]
PTAEMMCEAQGPTDIKSNLTGDPYKVRALLVSATNPVNSYGDAKMTLEALKQVEFLVTCDYWMTPTALYSDYVMPIAGALERPTIHTNYGVTDSIITNQRAIQPMYDRHTDYSFWHDLALACGQAPEMWPWDNEEEVFYYILYPLGYPVSSFDEFVENFRFYYPPLEYYKYGENGFSTASRRVELKSSILEELGYPSLPTYIGCAENEVDNPEIAEEYPLVLTTGGGFMPYHHSEQFQIESVRYLRHEPYFTINPEKAAEMGIEEGDWCWIETRRGRIKQRANVEPSVDPRVIYAQRGWWYPERGSQGAEPFGCLESNVNVLSSVDDEHCDPIGGSWANRGLLCKVYKVTPGDTKVDTQYSIPGSSSEPGVTVMPKDSKLAYEPIPYDPKPDFEVPAGLVWNKSRKVAHDPESGLVYDPASGWLYHPETQIYYDLETRLAYDPTTETLMCEITGKHYDMATKQELSTIVEGGE